MYSLLYSLRRGDSDIKRIYNGRVRNVLNDKIYNISRLKKSLVRVGILYFGTDKTKPEQVGAQEDFDLCTEWAVREFQIYAKAPKALKEIIRPDGSIQRKSIAKTEQQIYRGPISGVFDAETARFLNLWLGEDNQWHCPVIVAAINNRKHKVPAKTDMMNVWHSKDQPINQRGFRVLDYSGFFEPHKESDDEDRNLNYIDANTTLPRGTLVIDNKLDGNPRGLRTWNTWATYSKQSVGGPFTHHRDPWPDKNCFRIT